MYDVNWTTIQSWDNENWNLTKHHEKLNVSGKYYQERKLNKRENYEAKQTQKKPKSQEITFTLSATVTTPVNMNEVSSWCIKKIHLRKFDRYSLFGQKIAL